MRASPPLQLFLALVFLALAPRVGTAQTTGGAQEADVQTGEAQGSDTADVQALADTTAPALTARDSIVMGLAAQWGHIQMVRSQLEQVEDFERDGLNNRIDELALAWADSLETVLVSVRDEDGVGAASMDTLVALGLNGMQFGTEREARLRLRISQERDLIGKFEDSAQADISRAFIQDLVRLRLEYLARGVTLVQLLSDYGADTTELSQGIEDSIVLLLEQLTGQIRLDATSLADLRTRLRADPTDQELQNAIDLVQAKHARNLDNLEALLPTAEDFGLGTAEQRGLLIRERGTIGVDILERDVFRSLWNDQLASLREGVVRAGPDVIFRIILFVLMVVAAWLLARPVRMATRYVISHERFDLGELLRELVVSLSGLLVVTAGLILGLTTLGLSLGPVLAGLGVLGLVVGLAIQDSLANLAAGVMILVFRPFDRDDVVSVGGQHGKVARVTLLATTITTFDNEAVTIPNGRIWGDTIVNHTAHRVRRVDIPVSFGYGEDPDRVRDVVLEVIQGHESVLATPEPAVHVDSMADSAVVIMAKPWVRTEDYWPTRWELTRRIKKRLDAEGIEIPFPQRVVTLRREEPDEQSGARAQDPGPETAGPAV